MNPFALMPYDNITLTLFNREREKEQALKRLEELGALKRYHELTSGYIHTLAYYLTAEDYPLDSLDEQLYGMILASEDMFATNKYLRGYRESFCTVVRYIRDKLASKPSDLSEIHKEIAILHGIASHLSDRASDLYTSMDEINSTISDLESDSDSLKDDVDSHYNEVYDFDERIEKLLVTVRERVGATTDEEEKYLEEAEF